MSRKRPLILTIFCVLGFLGAAAGILAIPFLLGSQFYPALIFLFHVTGWSANWWIAPYALVLVLNIASMVGIWRMRKWGVISFAILAGINLVAVLWLWSRAEPSETIGLICVGSMLLNLILVALVWVGYSIRLDSKFWVRLAFQVAALLLAFAFTTLVLVLAGAPPLQAYWNIIVGIVDSFSKLSDILVSWLPLLLATFGLLITFSAGLWNIGIEGQITLGAIFTTWALRLMQDSAIPAGLIIVISMVAGMLGGALWAALAGALKTFGGVNEIFGGLGLNFVATALTIWLIFGPWKRPGTGSMSGTQPFPEALWLPMFPGLRLSPWSLVLGLAVIVIVFFLLRGTYFGLRLKAVGKNMRAAFLMGVPTWQYVMYAFLICGLFAGLAGGLQVTAVYHRLIPAISSGYGFLGLLVAMLVNYQAVWAAPIALFFAALNIGSIRLPIVLKLDSTLAGVLQGVLVLFVLLVEGARQRWLKKR